MKDTVKVIFNLPREPEGKELMKLAIDFDMKPNEAAQFVVREALKKVKSIRMEGRDPAITDFEYSAVENQAPSVSADHLVANDATNGMGMEAPSETGNEEHW